MDPDFPPHADDADRTHAVEDANAIPPATKSELVLLGFPLDATAIDADVSISR